MKKVLFSLFFLVSVTLRAESPYPLPDGEAKSNQPAQLSFMLFTPSLHETSFDRRFSAWGLASYFSAPLMELGQVLIHVETGVTLLYSQLSLATPATEFSHLYLGLPVRLRAVLEFSGFSMEGVLGLHARLIEYDSRPAPAGGIHLTSDFFGSLDADIGVGGSLPLSDTSVLRLTLTYSYLAVGVGFDF